MSVAGLLDAMRSDYPPAVRLVWQCLENHAVSCGRCWRMTHEQLAGELHLSVRQVQRSVELLADDKIIRVERFKRRVSTFHMLRTYGENDGGAEPHYRNGHTFETELTGQIVTSSGLNDPPHEYLTGHPDTSSGELTGQIVTSTPELTGQIVTPESTSKNPTSKHPPTSRARARDVDECPVFETFWKAYPRKAGIDDARLAWGRAVRRASPEIIMAGLARTKWRDNPNMILYPAKWLDRGHWADEVDEFDPVLRAVGLSPDDFEWPRTLQ